MEGIKMDSMKEVGVVYVGPAHTRPHKIARLEQRACATLGYDQLGSGTVVVDD